MEKNGKKRVVMISLDAVGKRDMEYLLQKPNFSNLAETSNYLRCVGMTVRPVID